MHMEAVAKSFVFDHFFSTNNKLDYLDIIHHNKVGCQTRKESLDEDSIDFKCHWATLKITLYSTFLTTCCGLDICRITNLLGTFKSIGASKLIGTIFWFLDGL